MLKFTVGKVIGSHKVKSNLKECKTGDFRRAIEKMLRRHLKMNWGMCSEKGAKLNDDAVKTGCRIVSKYSHNDTNYYVITEANRSTTNILEYSEY